MPREIHTHFLPSLFEPADLDGGTAVVIDVLRASTTICHALAAGAKAVIPCAEIEEARQLAANLAGENVVLGGERQGKRIDGFDLGNSPSAYTPETVGGKTVVFTTTNGTRALFRCAEAERILIGSFNNLSAVVNQLLKLRQPIHLVCAGTNGNISQDDVLLAGALFSDCAEGNDDIPQIDDETSIAADFYQLNLGEMTLEALKESRGGRNLLNLGLDADIERAAEIDRFDFVPVFSPQSGRVTK
ncbi:MAG: 2-phosphosulfolactate phosphatase [Planctomycetes bacterium]|nr:2-phosphosulfolactate phosphatase [Planctomycetota bacterium]